MAPLNESVEDFDALVQRHKQSVYLLALRMTGNREDAEDLAQEAFLRAHCHLPQIHSHALARAWLLKVTANLCINYRRSLFRRFNAMRAYFEIKLRHAAGDVSFETSDWLDLALGRLKPRWRAAVSLVWFEGFTHREAAKVLGCSEGTVSWMISRARDVIRQTLEEVSGEEAVHFPRKGGR